MSFPKYPGYKDSDVEWLGEVPQSWTVKRLGYYFTERREKVSDVDFEPLSVTKQGIVPQLETAAKTDDNDNRKKVCAGDFVINSRSDRKGSSGISDRDGSVSLINTVLCPREDVLGIFVHHLFRSIPFQEEFYRYGKGIVADLWSTNYSEMKSIVLAVPPLPEQSAIATFLDRETSKIDVLVAEQEKLIELLKEKRQAVISHAVTKGLDPNVPMKNSGVEWLGEVPEHWAVHKLGYKCLLQGGYAFASESFCSDGIPIVRMNNLSRGSLNLEEAVCIPADCSIDKVSLNNGDLIWGMSGSIGDTGSLGNFARVRQKDIPCQLNQRVGRFLPKDSGVSIDFLEWLIQSKYFYEQILLLVTGTAQFNVSSNQVESCIVSLPPQDEQYEIVLHLAAEVKRLEALQAESQRAIDLLKERRSALISAAVTGKIDVRGLADATQ